MFSICKIFGLFLFGNIHYNYTDTLPKKIASGLETWTANNPAEKVFLHTDKSTYLAGENIWYKAYLTLDAAPSILSKIVYVDLVDENGRVVEKQMRPIINGNTSGDIILPKELPTGNYSINAYSLWMLNYQPFIFKKNIKVYNYDVKPVIAKKQAADFTVNFFPEGGDLVEGLKSTVGFYIVDKNGMPLDATGTITDQTNKTIATITTAHTGYGKVEITPVANEVLTAAININGVSKKFKLPAPKKEGITIRVNNAGASMVFVKVERNVTDPSRYNNVIVAAQIRGKLAFMGQVNFAENATGMAIPKKNLPAGILQITAFDSLGNPLAERLIFINNYELPEVAIQMDSVSSLMKAKNRYRLDLSKFETPSVSVAVTDADLSSQPAIDDNIVSNLLLTSDLKGYIHQPGYYFQNKTASTNEHLDLLMLTHGWRRFKWEDVINKIDIGLKYPVESAISVSGKVTIPVSTKAITGGYVDIITKGEDSTTILSKAPINNKGEFYINDLNFKQKATVYLQGTKASNTNANVDIIINKAYIDTLKNSAYKPTSLEENLMAAGANEKLLAIVNQETEQNNVHKLADVKVTTKKLSSLEQLEAAYASDLFRMGQGLEITSNHYLSVWQFLREQVAGLTVEGDMVNPNVYFNRFAGLTAPVATIEGEEGVNQAGGMESNGITYFLNEINVSKDVVSTLHPSDIALIKVFKGPEGTILGLNEGGIAIYTKKGTIEKGRTGEKGFFKETKIGYAVTREFYNPNYSIVPSSTTKDNRTTLYWNSNLRTDKSGSATIRFYNNDITKKFKITIQGIDKNGKLISKEQVIE